MFDTYRITPSSPEIHVHNESKPHDAADAARLYGQLKDKAEKAVASATVERFGADNELSAVVVHADKDYLRDKVRTRVIFRLNGTLHDLRLESDANAVAMGLNQEVAWKLVESIVGQLRRQQLLKR